MAEKKEAPAAMLAQPVVAPAPAQVMPHAAAAAGTVRLEVPPGVTAVGVGGQQFPVEGGGVDVPHTLAAEARQHLAALWRCIKREAEKARAAMEAAAAMAEMPNWARDLEQRLEKKLLGR